MALIKEFFTVEEVVAINNVADFVKKYNDLETIDIDKSYLDKICFAEATLNATYVKTSDKYKPILEQVEDKTPERYEECFGILTLGKMMEVDDDEVLKDIKRMFL